MEKPNQNNRPVSKFIYFWLPVIVWSLIIFSFSSQKIGSTSEVYWTNFVEKKLAHLVEYAILSILYFRAFKASGIKRKNAALWAIIICFLYGATDEFHQSFTPSREPTLRDAVIDALGASIGMLAIWKLLPKAPKKLIIWATKLQIDY